MKIGINRSEFNSNNILSFIIALGLVLFPIDNIIFSIGIFRLKDFGLLLIIIGCLGILIKERKLGGDYRVNIVVMIIALVIVIDSIFRASGLYKFYNILLAGSFILIYFISMKREYKITRLFFYAVIIESISCIIQGILNIKGVEYSYFVGGIITSTGVNSQLSHCANYNLACGYIAFGTILSTDKQQRILIPLVILAVFFIGSIEGIYIFITLLAWMIIKKNYNRAMFIELSIAVLFIIIWSVFGTGRSIWHRLLPASKLVSDTSNSHELAWKTMGWKYFIDNFKWYGNGYLQLVSNKIYDTIHNVPLVIVQQIGVVPAIAWIYASMVSLIKSKFSIIWIGLLVMCIADHMVWTNLVIYWWMIVGISFRKEI